MEGVSDYTIVVAEGADRADLHKADEPQRFVGLSTGAVLPFKVGISQGHEKCQWPVEKGRS